MSENERVLWHQLAEFAERLRLSEIEHDRIYSELKEQIECLEYDLGQAEGRKRDAEEYWRTARETLQSHIDKEIELTKEVVMLKNHNKELMRENVKLIATKHCCSDPEACERRSEFMDFTKKVLSWGPVHDPKEFPDCRIDINAVLKELDSLEKNGSETEWYDAEKCLPMPHRKVVVELESQCPNKVKVWDRGELRVMDGSPMICCNGVIVNSGFGPKFKGSYKALKWKYADENI